MNFFRVTLLLGALTSPFTFAATKCHLVKSEDLDKKVDKVPADIFVDKVTEYFLQYHFTRVRGKKVITCKVPKTKEEGPLDRSYTGYEHYAYPPHEPAECLDAYLDRPLQKAHPKSWSLVLIGNYDGAATFECR